MADRYAQLYFFDGNDPECVDDDGDVCNGWYFQFMQGDEEVTGLFGPYGSARKCEAAAIREHISG